MNKEITISVFEVVGNRLCVASGDGQKVYDRLAAALENDRKVSLSFRNVSALTSAFLNAAIGQLYGKFKESRIRELIKVKDIDSDDIALLKRVVETAKLYFKDPEKFDEALRTGMEDGGDDA